MSAARTRLSVLTIGAAAVRLASALSSVSLAVQSHHECIGNCLTDANNLPSALGCAVPLDNGCYCATATALLSTVASHLTQCASVFCAARDRNGDLSTMAAMYASYCTGAGFVMASMTSAPPGAPTATPESSARQGGNGDGGVLVVTRTLPPTVRVADGPPRTTSTVWVDANGNVVPTDDAAAASPAPGALPPGVVAGLGIGLGVGIPLVATLMFGAWWCGRRQRPARNDERPSARRDLELEEMVAPYGDRDGHKVLKGSFSTDTLSSPSVGMREVATSRDRR